MMICYKVANDSSVILMETLSSRRDDWARRRGEIGALIWQRHAGTKQPRLGVFEHGLELVRAYEHVDVRAIGARINAPSQMQTVLFNEA